jgi:1,4-alpha-glucan branching enzyme/maltooligosyltrehalose trehalohydrolase
MPFGAEVTSAGVRFRLWAPAAKRVDLALGTGFLPMRRGTDGWFERVEPAAAAGTLYRYRIDEETLVPDPASRFQPQDADGPSEVVDPAAFAWEDAAWRGRPWREAVIYELHVGTFSAQGSYTGVRRRLAQLSELGITAIELMPLSDFAGKRNWGYDGVLPYAPDSTYGRPELLKRLVQAAHAEGLMVILESSESLVSLLTPWRSKGRPLLAEATKSRYQSRIGLNSKPFRGAGNRQDPEKLRLWRTS